jgi:hypothetical protein
MSSTRFTPAQITQIARSSNCGRQAVIDYLAGVRRTMPAIAAAIDVAAARILCDEEPAETLLAGDAAQADGAVRMYGAVPTSPIQAAADALNAEVTARAEVAKAAAAELVQAVRSAVAKGVPVEVAARVLLKAAAVAAEKRRTTL